MAELSFDLAAARFALYFAPTAGSAHDRFGTHWLGRDARTGERPAQPAVAGFTPERLAALTSAPRLYGLHATLKPPMYLAEGSNPAQLEAAVATIAAAHAPFHFNVELAPLHGFLAWVASDAQEQIRAVADQCVRELDPFRRPPDAAELARRSAHGLSPRESELLLRWGYPHVFDQFRFHITLSDRIDDADESARLLAALREHSAALADEALVFDALDIFVQPSKGAELVHWRRFPLGAPA
ncbi:DUF1045 domain-containing protein [Viridibacterium curvum]|uniref:DUF1045 domain-containing protein n=1 Tax=Viridibacterium curvum TaxID=1101404 RepID=A0ABP9Q6U4_9RHOO